MNDTMKYQKENVETLLNLIKENPDLPIVPMVASEIVADDSCSYWLGDWGTAKLTEVYVGEERIHFRYDDEEDVLTDLSGCKFSQDFDGRDVYELSEEEWKSLYESLPWVKAIVVYITT